MDRGNWGAARRFPSATGVRIQTCKLFGLIEMNRTIVSRPQHCWLRATESDFHLTPTGADGLRRRALPLARFQLAAGPGRTATAMIFRCLMGVSVSSSNQTDFVHEKRSKRVVGSTGEKTDVKP